MPPFQPFLLAALLGCAHGLALDAHLPLYARTSLSLHAHARHMPVLAADAEPPSLTAAGFVRDRAPGVALSVLLAYPAEALARRTSLSPLLWASLAGIATGTIWRALGLQDWLKAGINFSKARLLRLGIILYGFKLTLQQLASIGLAGVSADLFTVCTTMLLGHQLGSLLRLPPTLTTLISSGASICGCSAVVATQPVVEGEPHEVAAAVGTVVLYGTIAMFLYPLLWTTVPVLAAPRLMGIFTGATVHELAGVVAAGNAMGPEVASIALVTKLVRVCMLAPMLLFLSSRQSAGSTTSASASKKKAPLPWFALGFLAVTLLNSCVAIDRSIIKSASKVSAFALATAMAALGVDADFGKILKLGPKPLVLATALWLHLLFVCGTFARLAVGAFPL